ncbi:Thaumatin-like protein 1 [Acorus gramineus]|uniref:Thaumatin-like protein 1 n=1 Tax=Acorus gramineus TaxID=55184 RepID=A0AAV9AVL6_ACOGR|nr:Thaumatin-like protein 1 [Acorus gramineus]
MLTRHALCCTFTITNACAHPIWPGTLAGAGTPQLGTTGFRLDSGGSAQVQAPSGWSGRIWARTGCAGNGTCETGDCGGKLECAGTGARPPVTLFEVTLGRGAGDDDYYDVSLVDGYNLPVLVAPFGGQGQCDPTGCAADLNSGCPKELQVEGEGGDEGGGGGGVVACKSACNAFGMDEYCCSGEYASPGTCKPSFYSAVFKRACPRAYSYAFDDSTSTFICKAFEYTITFCPSINGFASSLPLFLSLGYSIRLRVAVTHSFFFVFLFSSSICALH